MGNKNLHPENQCLKAGHRYIAGVDEVGMGCLAGPVVACAVILSLDNIPEGIKDSKLLTPKRREALDQEIRRSCLAASIGVAEPSEVDDINVLQASRLAMKRAVQALEVPPDYLLIDGRFPVDIKIPQKSLIKGDRLSVSIGAASIVAKVYRDGLMHEMDLRFPGYEFAKHKGYGSVLHRQRLQEIGPSPIHRKSFSWTPV